MKTIKLHQSQISEIDNIRGENPRNKIVQRGIHALSKKEDIIKELLFLENNTTHTRLDEVRIKRAWAKVLHLVHGI